MLKLNLWMYGICAFIVCVGGISIIPILSDNLAAVRTFHTFSQSDLRIVREPNLVTSQQKRIAGALLLNNQRYDEGLRFLLDYIKETPDAVSPTWLLIGKAYQAKGEFLKAGYAYQNAGAFQELDGLLDSDLVKKVYDSSQIDIFSRILLALAADAEQRNDWSAALESSRRVRNLNVNEAVSSEAYRLEAKSALHFGDLRGTIALIRQSLDIVPPKDSTDQRYSILTEAAYRGVLHDGCITTPDNWVLSLNVIYGEAHFRVPSSCYEKLVQSALSNLPDAMQPYILLRQAITALQHGNDEIAREFLRAAESKGLSLAWSVVLLPENKLPSRIETLVPTYLLSDPVVLGYEIDPLQIELGLPLDVIIFYRSVANVQAAELKLIQAINLSPNPGNEYMATDCQFVDCQPLGYETDIYNGATASFAHKFVLMSRPLTPNDIGSNFVSNTLKLANQRLIKSFAGQSNSGMASFLRPIYPNGRYLQAGWIRAKNGNGFIGRCWKCDESDVAYNYIIEFYQKDEWYYANQIFVSPDDFHGGRLWFLNFDATGDVYFDGTIFIKIPEPF